MPAAAVVGLSTAVVANPYKRVVEDLVDQEREQYKRLQKRHDEEARNIRVMVFGKEYGSEGPPTQLLDSKDITCEVVALQNGSIVEFHYRGGRLGFGPSQADPKGWWVQEVRGELIGIGAQFPVKGLALELNGQGMAVPPGDTLNLEWPEGTPVARMS
jgi:hypothetical protein